MHKILENLLKSHNIIINFLHKIICKVQNENNFRKNQFRKFSWFFKAILREYKDKVK